MSRAFVAFYMGDYQKKTQHLDTLQHGAYFLLLQHCWTHGSIPLEPAARAAIARLPLAQWKKVAPIVNPFFDEAGRNKRASEEIEKSERISLQRAMAGRKGGFKSGVSKSVAKGQQLISKDVAIARRPAQQTTKQKPSISEAIQNPSITTTFSGSTREAAETSETPQFAETHRLLAGLERLKQAKQSAIAPEDPVKLGKVWVDFETEEWSAHSQYFSNRQIRMRLPIKRIDEHGVERTGAYFDAQWPPGYDEVTREFSSSSEDAA